MAEGETLLLKQNSTKIRFHEKMAKHGGKGFILTTRFYKSSNYATILGPYKHNLDGKISIQQEGTAVSIQQQTTTKQLAMQKIHTNDLHAKLGHYG